ncbi:MAG: hypothetical protein ACOZIN_21895 [Myxococcota bacterium]
MGFIKFVVWTSLAVGLGIFLATQPVLGRTPVEHAQRAWENGGPHKLQRLKAGIGEAVDEVRAARRGQPTERYSTEERAAVNDLFAKKR